MRMPCMKRCHLLPSDMGHLEARDTMPYNHLCACLAPHEAPVMPKVSLCYRKAGAYIKMRSLAQSQNFSALRKNNAATPLKTLAFVDSLCFQRFLCGGAREDEKRKGGPYFLSVKENVRPPPSLLCTAMVPPCSWTAFFTMASPRPVPPRERLRPLSMR